MTHALTHVGGGSRKFWHAELRGRVLTVRFGRIGSAGQTQITKFASASAAASKLAGLVRAKRAKGYADEAVAIEPADPAAVRQILSRGLAPSRVFAFGPRVAPAQIRFRPPAGFALIGAFHHVPELPIRTGRALVVMLRTKLDAAFRKRVANVPLTAGAKPTAGVAVWDVPATSCPAVVLDPQSGGDLFGIDNTDPLVYRAIKLGARFVDFDFEALVSGNELLDAELTRGTLARSMAPFLDGRSLAASRKLAERLRFKSRIGGVPAWFGTGRALPRGDWRHALHLANDLFGLTFGDLGCLRVWLAAGRAFTQVDD